MNAIDILKYGHQTVLNTLSRVPEAEWETDGVCGVWSVKDILAHLASYEHMLVEVLGSFLEEGPTPYLAKMGELGPQGFNDAEVSRRRDKSGADVVDEYKETQAQALALAAQISPEIFHQNGTLPWYGAEYDLDDFIVYSFYGHKREHSAQIAVFADSVG